MKETAPQHRRSGKGKTVAAKPVVTEYYPSPLGLLCLTADAEGLRSVDFVEAAATVRTPRAGEPDPAKANDADAARTVLTATKHWLDVYFAGRDPGALPPLHLLGTPFQQCVWALLRQIPYGTTTTYGQLAVTAARQLGKDRMAPQAVGNAVGRNPVAILVPCHRVVGANGSLTGYAYGVNKKATLLKLEK